MPRFFINRPIFAWVIAIMVMLAGLLALKTLPVSQYPPIAPPQITINAMYPGASAQTVQDTVTQVIEQKLNGIDNLIYMSSTSDSAGAVAINMTFKAGTDPNIAQVQVQNKLQLATPLLPQIVQRLGISVVKSTRNFLLIFGLVSEDDSMDRNALADYMVSNLQDIISRLEGVGELQLFGSQNAMRIWLNPAKLNNFHLTVSDVNYGAAGPERPDFRRSVRRYPSRTGPATQRHHHRPYPAADPGAVRCHHSADQQRRLHRQAQGCG